ncbi:STAS/SEC14 domain-containing protein [Hymenobacter psychrophilus]|uniref:STAS/SEC14 domain-containing protein n=1 Tax=Hymenobacter psychrophilus TaxID=651662 RepID=UPI0011150149|nr:STAS/SEC14 domain-containing protein [Hymenobacter psychrophilus]
MMEVETLENALVVRYERNAALLHAQWQFLAAPHWAPSALRSLLTALAGPRVRACLLDLQHMPDLASLGQGHTEYHLLLQLAALPLHQLALVLKTDRQHEAVLAAASQLMPSFEVQVFDDAATALDWLRQTGEGYRGGPARRGPLSN